MRKNSQVFVTFRLYFKMGKAISVQRNATAIQSSKYIKGPHSSTEVISEAITVKIQNGLPTERTDIPNRFDSALNERLKQIYVTSQNTNYKVTSLSGNMLPIQKSSRSMEVPHLQNNETIVPAKLTLNQVNSLLSANQKKPNEWTPSKISEHFGIQTDHAEKLLRYFGYFEVYVSDPKNIHANETLSGGKLENPENIPNQLKPSTNFDEMKKIMGFRKMHGFNEKRNE